MPGIKSSSPFKAIAFDLDGTLLNSKGHLSQKNIDCLRKLAERKIQILLVSGRMTPRTLPYAQQLNFPLTMITYNGAETLSGFQETWIKENFRSVDIRAVQSLLELCRVQKIFANLYSEGLLYGYHPDGDFNYANHYREQTGAEYHMLYSQYSDLPQKNIAKLLIIETPENRNKLFNQWGPKLEGICALTKSNPEYLEFLGLGINKGSTLQIWLDKNNILPNQLLAFGDAENDLEMLSLAGLGIAMKNATPGLKKEINTISMHTNDEDGIAHELSRIFDLNFE